MNRTAQRYDDAARPLTAVLDAAPADAWDRPSPCAGWTAADVVTHLVTTQREFLAQHGVATDVGGPPAGDPAATWREHAAAVAAVIADEDVTGRPFDGYFGPTTVGASFEQFYIWDMLVHRWDLARATGAEAGLTDAELERIDAGADSFGPALHSDGVCGPPIRVASDAGRETRVLARLGRS